MFPNNSTKRNNQKKQKHKKCIECKCFSCLFMRYLCLLMETGYSEVIQLNTDSKNPIHQFDSLPDESQIVGKIYMNSIHRLCFNKGFLVSQLRRFYIIVFILLYLLFIKNGLINQLSQLNYINYLYYKIKKGNLVF